MKTILILILVGGCLTVQTTIAYSQNACNCKDTDALSIKLDLMEKSDQHNRLLMYQPNVNNDSLWILQNKIDSINLIELATLFKTYDFCCLNKLNSLAIESVLAHSPEEIRKNFFLPIIYASTIAGNGNPHMYANLVDQMLVYSNKKQLYGMIACKGNPEVLSELCPIENVEGINARRREIGLNTIEEQCKAKNQKMPDK